MRKVYFVYTTGFHLGLMFLFKNCYYQTEIVNIFYNELARFTRIVKILASEYFTQYSCTHKSLDFIKILSFIRFIIIPIHLDKLKTSCLVSKNPARV